MLHRMFAGEAPTPTEFGFLTASDVDLNVFMPPVREHGVSGMWLSSGPSGAREITGPGILEVADDYGWPLMASAVDPLSVSGMWMSSGASGPSTAPEEPPEPPPIEGLAVGVRHLPPPPDTGYESSIGRSPDVWGDYTHGDFDQYLNGSWAWLDNPNQSHGNLDNYNAHFASNNKRLDWALGLCPWGGPTRGSSVDNGAMLAAVAAGTHNSHFATAANVIANTYPNLGNRPLYVRLGWEMNLRWSPWKVINTDFTLNATKAANFAAAWRQIYDTFHNTQSGIQWKFVWAPFWSAYWNSTFWPNGLLLFYPGDAYVDLIGSDHYDADSQYSVPPTDAQRLTVWNNRHLVALTNMNTFATAHGKPQFFGEWGIWHDVGSGSRGGDDNPLFIQNMHNRLTTTNFEYAVYFNRNVSGSVEHSLTSFGTLSKANARAMYINTFGQLPHPF